MRTLLLLCLISFQSVLQATIHITSTLPAETFLQYESIPVQIQITNRTGEDIVLREDDPENQVLLRVRDMQDGLIPRRNVPLLEEPWVIPDGESSERTFDLMQLYHVSAARSYRGLRDIVVQGEVFKGRPILFRVVPGTEMRSVRRRNTDRVFTLYAVNRNNRDDLMLRVMNYNRTMNYATYYLERFMRHYPPHIRMGSSGEVTTLHYARPNVVVVCRFEPDGRALGRSYYQATPGTAVRLVESPDGGFEVIGATPMDSNDQGGGSGERR